MPSRAAAPRCGGRPGGRAPGGEDLHVLQGKPRAGAQDRGPHRPIHACFAAAQGRRPCSFPLQSSALLLFALISETSEDTGEVLSGGASLEAGFVCLTVTPFTRPTMVAWLCVEASGKFHTSCLF